MSTFNASLTSFRTRLWLPVGVLLYVLMLGLHFGSHKPLWMDEILTLSVAQISSVPAMLKALFDGMDTSPPLLFLIEWATIRCFGASELVMRLPSLIPFAVGCAILVRLLALRFGRAAALIGFFQITCSSIFYIQLAEARFYGLLWLLVVFGLVDASGSPEKPSRMKTAGFLLVYFAMPLTHIYGVFYSGFLIFGKGAAMLLTHRERAWRPLIFSVFIRSVATACGLALWLPGYISQSNVGKPYSWISIPSIGDLLHAFTFDLHLALMFLTVAFCAIHYVVRSLEDRSAAVKQDSSGTNCAEARIIIPAIFLLGVLPFSFLFSRCLVSIFMARYFIGALAGVWVLLTWAYSLLLAGQSESAAISRACLALRVATVVLVALLTSLFLYKAHSDSAAGETWHVLRAEDNASGLIPPDATVLCESPHMYLPRNYYDRSRSYVYVGSWKAALSPGSIKNDVTDYHLMREMARHSSDHRIALDDDWNQPPFSRFYLLDEPARKWSNTADLSGWRRTVVGQFDRNGDPVTIVLFEK